MPTRVLTALVLTVVPRKRLLALASQKFIADVATDALQWSKIRQQQPTRRVKTNAKVCEARLISRAYSVLTGSVRVNVGSENSLDHGRFNKCIIRARGQSSKTRVL